MRPVTKSETRHKKSNPSQKVKPVTKSQTRHRKCLYSWGALSPSHIEHRSLPMARLPPDNEIDYREVARMFEVVFEDPDYNTIALLQEGEALYACYDAFPDEMAGFVHGEEQPGSGDITPVNLDRPTDEPIDTEMILRTTDPMFLYEKVFFALQTCIEQPGIPLDPIQNEQNWNKQWTE